MWLPRCRVRDIPSIVKTSAKPKIGNEKELKCNVDDIKMAGKKHELSSSHVEESLQLKNRDVDDWPIIISVTHVYLGCTQRQCEIRKQRILWTITESCSNREILYGDPLAGLWLGQESIWVKRGPAASTKRQKESSKLCHTVWTFVHREKGLFLSVYVDDIKVAGKIRKHWVRCSGKYIVQRSWFGRTNMQFLLIMCTCLCTQKTTCKNNAKILQDYQITMDNHFWIQNFAYTQVAIGKCYHDCGKSVHLRISVMSWWHGPWHKWPKWCGKWRYCEYLANKTWLNNSYKVSTPLHWWPSFQRSFIRTWNPWEKLVKRMALNVSASETMLIFWHVHVDDPIFYGSYVEQACTMDHRMWPMHVTKRLSSSWSWSTWNAHSNIVTWETEWNDHWTMYTKMFE